MLPLCHYADAASDADATLISAELPPLPRPDATDEKAHARAPALRVMAAPLCAFERALRCGAAAYYAQKEKRAPLLHAGA